MAIGAMTADTAAPFIACDSSTVKPTRQQQGRWAERSGQIRQGCGEQLRRPGRGHGHAEREHPGNGEDDFPLNGPVDLLHGQDVRDHHDQGAGQHHLADGEPDHGGGPNGQEEDRQGQPALAWDLPDRVPLAAQHDQVRIRTQHRQSVARPLQEQRVSES